MSYELMAHLSEKEQQKFFTALYSLLEKQVQSYHKNRHMGQNSSVPAELAQELMASVEYTLSLAGGIAPDRELEEILDIGQKILEEKVTNAAQMLRLVASTAPDWQTQCRWEAIDYLRRYLETYDYRHLAHRSPESLFYPILISVPEGLQGIDLAQFYIRVMWEENQIMDGFSQEEQGAFWTRLPADTLNQCDHVLLNALGKNMVGGNGLCFIQQEWDSLETLSAEAFARRWEQALAQTNWGDYGRLAAEQMFSRVQAAHRSGNIYAVFL